MFLLKIHAVFPLLCFSMIPLDVQSVCTRQPDISCRHVQNITQCDNDFWTCEAYCEAGGAVDTCAMQNQACRIQRDDVVDMSLTANRCDSLANEMDCQAYMDCLWIDDDDEAMNSTTTTPLEGPFDPLCAPTNDAQWATVPSLLGVSLSFFLQETCIPTPTCGVSNTTLGQWFILTSRTTAPLTFSTKDQLVSTDDTTFPTILSVFQADPSVPGTMTCLGYNSGTTDKPDQSSVTIPNVQQGDVFYVLLSARDLDATNAEVGDKAGQWRMSIEPATAQAHCAYDCDTTLQRAIALKEEPYTSCECIEQQAGEEDTVKLQSAHNCEICHTANENDELSQPSFCLIYTNEITYGGPDGAELFRTYCYQITKGVHAGNTVCLDSNASQRGITQYRINGQACVTNPDPSCYRSNQYDCSAVLNDERAIFNGCSGEGYVGVLEVERLYEIDFTRLQPQSGQCYESNWRAPSSAPSQSPTTAENGGDDTSSSTSIFTRTSNSTFWLVTSLSAVWLLLLG